VVLALFARWSRRACGVGDHRRIMSPALEIMDRNSIQAVELLFPTGLPTDAAMPLIEIDGLAEALTGGSGARSPAPGAVATWATVGGRSVDRGSVGHGRREPDDVL
jgi:hypothetical protein